MEPSGGPRTWQVVDLWDGFGGTSLLDGDQHDELRKKAHCPGSSKKTCMLLLHARLHGTSALPSIEVSVACGRFT